MAGLLGMGGMGGGNDPALQSLLGSGFDQGALRNMQIKSLLANMGASMLSQGPSATPIGFGQMLGQGFGAGINGANQAKQDYMGQAKMAYDVKRQGINDAWSQKEQARKEQEWAEADKRKQAFDNMIGGLPEDQRAFAQAYPDQYGKQKADALFPEAGGGAEYGLNPVWLQNPETGEYMLVQPSKDGSPPRQMQFPQGYQPAPQNRSVDTGTGYVTQPTRGVGTPIGAPIQKDLAGAEFQKEMGTAAGKATASAPADIAAADSALILLDQIENHPYIDRGTGLTSAGNVAWGTGGFDFQNIVDQSKSGAFLTAIQTMRGLGSLSNTEGQTATAAVTRMNTATSKEAFLKALSDYKAEILKGRSRAEAKLSGGAPQAQPVPQGGNLKQKYGLEE